MDQEFDLFGDPVRLPSGKRGRPAHVATQKNRNKVMVLLALGWSNERIAHALHCSAPTLRKHYFSELKRRDIQRDRLDAYRFEKVLEQVEAGNVGAQRLLSQMIEKNDMMRAASRLREDPAPDQDDASLGKKETARRRAKEVVEGESQGEWGDDLTPGYAH